MKIEHWRFLASKSDAGSFTKSVLIKLEPHSRNLSGDYCAISIDGLRTMTSKQREQIISFLMCYGGGVQINLSPLGWSFFVEFASVPVQTAHAAKSPIGSWPEPGWFEITASTDAIWKEATLQDSLVWNESLEYLAMTIITTAKPKWGVRLNEQDYDYISETDMSLLEYPIELWRGDIPRLLGRVTYLDEDLYSKLNFNVLRKEIDVRPLTPLAGGFLIVDPSNWVDALSHWSCVELSQ